MHFICWKHAADAASVSFSIFTFPKAKKLKLFQKEFLPFFDLIAYFVFENGVYLLTNAQVLLIAFNFHYLWVMISYNRPNVDRLMIFIFLRHSDQW